MSNCETQPKKFPLINKLSSFSFVKIIANLLIQLNLINQIALTLESSVFAIQTGQPGYTIDGVDGRCTHTLSSKRDEHRPVPPAFSLPIHFDGEKIRFLKAKKNHSGWVK